MLYMELSRWGFLHEAKETDEQIGLVLNCHSRWIRLVSRTVHPRRGLSRLNVPQTQQ